MTHHDLTGAVDDAPSTDTEDDADGDPPLTSTNPRVKYAQAIAERIDRRLDAHPTYVKHDSEADSAVFFWNYHDDTKETIDVRLTGFTGFIEDYDDEQQAIAYLASFVSGQYTNKSAQTD